VEGVKRRERFDFDADTIVQLHPVRLATRSKGC